MQHPDSHPIKLVRTVLRVTGVINIMLSLIGTSFVVDSIYRFSTGKYLASTLDAPYFRATFVMMLAIEAAFLAILTAISIRQVKARPSAISWYSLWTVALILYHAVIQILWRPGPIGESVASASAITTDGIFLELLFWIPSAILLQIAQRRFRTDPDDKGVFVSHQRRPI